MAKAKAAALAVVDEAGALILSAPAGLSDSVRTLEQFGTLEGGRFIMRPDVSLLAWVTQVLPAAVVANEGAQFTLADALLAGYHWRDVEAVDLQTGEPADEDAGYTEGSGAVPFSYSQIAEILGRPAATVANYLTVARRFGPETRLDYPSARFSHFAVCAARDLPDDFVAGLLARAGRGGPDGLSVHALEVEIANWRRDRDQGARDRTAAIKANASGQGGVDRLPPPMGGSAAPKPGGIPKRPGMRGEVLGTRDGLLMADAVATCRKPLREMLAVVSDLDDAAAAIVRWLYTEAPESAILGALAYRMAVETGEAPF